MKCKINFKKVGGVCIPGKKRIVQTTKQFPDIMKFVISFSILSLGGWAIFSAIISIFKLDGMNPWLMLLLGVIIVFISGVYGWRKFK